MKFYKLWSLLPIFCFSVIFSGFQTEEKLIEKKESWPEASSYLEGVPIYEKFSDLESLFRFENDTTYVINFWATWCKPCIEELPYFESLHEKYQDKKVRVVLVSLDFPRHLESKLLPFLEKHSLASTVLVLLDGSYNDWIDKISPKWSGAIPASLIYNKKEKRFFEDAFPTYEALEAALP
ncbi:MAG: TlpA disulfide reductase family protein [Bacteroidia bacterium]|nr:TlpA disulfide reductase family protein [Bacteroidia bacterium]